MQVRALLSELKDSAKETDRYWKSIQDAQVPKSKRMVGLVSLDAASICRGAKSLSVMELPTCPFSAVGLRGQH